VDSLLVYEPLMCESSFQLIQEVIIEKTRSNSTGLFELFYSYKMPIVKFIPYDS